jgi:hypothetical protein
VIAVCAGVAGPQPSVRTKANAKRKITFLTDVTAGGGQTPHFCGSLLSMYIPGYLYEYRALSHFTQVQPGGMVAQPIAARLVPSSGTLF